MSTKELLVALDARVIGRRSTGDSTYWSGLLQGLSRIDHGFKFLLYSNAQRPKGIPESSHFEWIHLPSRGDRWWSLVRFPLAARARGAKAIHTQYNLSPLVGSVGITTIHDVSFWIGPEWFQARDRLLLQRFVPASARRAARVITVSETSRRDIARFLPEAAEKLRVTPLGVNPAITPMPREQAAKIVKDETGIEGPFLLTVGTRWPRKNMELAVHAADLLDMRFPHRLAVTGKPGWGESNAGERTVPTGYVSDHTLSALYSAADLYLAPSRYEGFGLPLLEAFACKCPVICSSGGALPEVAGGAATVLESWSPEAWAHAIMEALDDSSKLQFMRESGARRAASFRWEDTAAKTCAVYREVIQ
jgi:glycosyltransferase involved in cell wall biosynthesis